MEGCALSTWAKVFGKILNESGGVQKTVCYLNRSLMILFSIRKRSSIEAKRNRSRHISADAFHCSYSKTFHFWIHSNEQSHRQKVLISMFTGICSHHFVGRHPKCSERCTAEPGNRWGGSDCRLHADERANSFTTEQGELHLTRMSSRKSTTDRKHVLLPCVHHIY